MTLLQGCILFLAAALGGGLNSIAGGGSFITFPALLFTGISPIPSNATSTVALWPGSLASAGAYRKELNNQRRFLILLGIPSVIGGVLGAILLLLTPTQTFVQLLPFLLLLATMLFTFGSTINARLQASRPARSTEQQSGKVTIGMLVVQFIIALYGGFYGGGIGMMMLAGLALMGMTDIHAMNALKNTLATCINGVAVVTFIIAGTVVWLPALVMVVGAIAGGYGTATFSRRLDPKQVRRFVIVVGFTMTLYFFVRTYLL